MAPRHVRGFTLLEVMISLGILGVAMLAISDGNLGALRMHDYSKRLTVATQLARGKLLDVQQLLRKDGLSNFSKEYHGNFEDEGEPGYKWRAYVIKPEIDIDPQQVLNLASSGLGIPGGQGGNVQGSAIANPLAAGGALNGVLDMQLKGMSETVKQSVREIKLTVSWKSLKGAEESFDLVEHVVVLPNAMQNAAANATPITPGAPGSTGAPGTGIPAPPGLQQLVPGGINAVRPPVALPLMGGGR